MRRGLGMGIVKEKRQAATKLVWSRLCNKNEPLSYGWNGSEFFGAYVFHFFLDVGEGWSSLY